MITLRTERLLLRPYEEADLPEYHRLMSDKKNMYFLDDIATSTPEESLESLRNAIAVNEQETARRFCVALKETGKLIGGVGYEIKTVTPVGYVPVGKIADPMGWFIMPEYQNKGYITEAARRVLTFAFNEDDCVRVVTGCYKDNAPTQKVMEKVGFRQEAEKINARWASAQWHDGKMKTRLEFAININDRV